MNRVIVVKRAGAWWVKRGAEIILDGVMGGPFPTLGEAVDAAIAGLLALEPPS